MKIREMDIYFTVPVDRAVLIARRKHAGFSSAAKFDSYLKQQGYDLSYVDVEYTTRSNKGREKNIRGDVAEVIALVLNVPIDSVFPAYAASKVAAMQEVTEQYYKPFTTVVGRDNAIVENMDIARYTALKYAYYLNHQHLLSRFDKEEAISIAYEVLVCVADKAMKKGIRKGATFERHLCTSIRNAFTQMGCKTTAHNADFDLFSYDDLMHDVPSKFNVEDLVIGIDVVQQTVQCLPDEYVRDGAIVELEKQLQQLKNEKKRDKRIRCLMEEMLHA